MLIQKRTLTLRDGRTLTLRSAAAADAAEICRHRRVTSGETDFMVRYAQECDTDPARTVGRLEALEKAPRDFAVTAFYDGQVVGDLEVRAVCPHLKCCHRASLGVSILARFCGAGLGTALLELAIEQARANGFLQLELGVFADNARAIHVYEKLGFVVCGTIPRAYRLKDGSLHDERLMVKLLQE